MPSLLYFEFRYFIKGLKKKCKKVKVFSCPLKSRHFKLRIAIDIYKGFSLEWHDYFLSENILKFAQCTVGLTGGREVRRLFCIHL